MSKGKPAQPKEQAFFRPFEAVAKQKLAELEEAKKAKAKPADPKKKPATPTIERPVVKHDAPTQSGGSFADMLYGVRPLAPGKRGAYLGEAAPKAATRKEPDPVAEAAAQREDEAWAHAQLRELVSGGDSRFEVSDDGARIEGRRVDVDRHVVRRLRRGELMIESRLDLHGLHAHEARAKLEDFLPKARTAGDRVVLIVCGKGQHSPRGIPVLRGEMAAWLSQGSASVHVAAFVTATPDDGGEGALYVLLRR